VSEYFFGLTEHDLCRTEKEVFSLTNYDSFNFKTYYFKNS